MAKVLTPQEAEFVAQLFNPLNRGNAYHALLAAGYPDGTKASPLISKFSEEILAHGEKILVSHTPRAIMELVGILDEPSSPAVRETISVCKEILDRAGLSKKDRMHIQHELNHNLFILPPKDAVK